MKQVLHFPPPIYLCWSGQNRMMLCLMSHTVKNNPRPELRGRERIEKVETSLENRSHCLKITTLLGKTRTRAGEGDFPSF